MKKGIKVLCTFIWKRGFPKVAEILKKFNLPKGALDKDFGIVLIDEESDTYCILVYQEDIPLDTELLIYGNPRIGRLNDEEE